MIHNSGKPFASLALRWLILGAILFTFIALLAPTVAAINPTPLPTAMPTPISTPFACQMGCGDLGDAPEVGMTAYPSATVPVAASFPTTYTAGMLSGPFHQLADSGPYLGWGVTLERNANQQPDQDILTNINVSSDTANRDGLDEGIFLIPSLDPCVPNDFTLTLTVPPGYAGGIYINAWFDFARDGDWNDTGDCGGAGVPEWAIRNWRMSLPPGTHVLTATVTTYHPVGMEHDPIWMRLTISDGPAPAPGGVSDGRGPAGGYLYGETEDYYLQYYEEEPCDGCAVISGWQG